MPETNEVKGIGFFDFHHNFWNLRKEITVAWSPFSFIFVLEDGKNMFTKENIHFMKDLCNNLTLKKEIEKLFYDDYLILLKSNLIKKKHPLIKSEEDIWKLLGSVSLPYGVIYLLINNDQTISMRFSHCALYDDIVINGKLESLILEHIRVNK